MANLGIIGTISDLEAFPENIREEIQIRTQAAAQILAQETYDFIQQRASQTLNTRKATYLNALSITNPSPDTYMINLAPQAEWIEKGMPEFSMLPGLLAKGKPIKSGPNKGGRYRIVPFSYPTDKNTPRTSLTNDLTMALKQQLKNRGVNWKKLDTDPSGAPKVGLLGSYNLTKPERQGNLYPGESGALGRPYTANARPPGQSGPEGRPYLFGVRIYQTPGTGGGNQEDNGVKRQYSTFRTASTSQIGTGKWKYPGVQGKFFFIEAKSFAENHWQNTVNEIFQNIL